MSKSLTRKAKQELEDSLKNVSKALRAAADDLSDDAETAVAQAAQALRKAAQALAEKAPREVEEMAGKAAAEARAHPIATAAAALSAATALITLLGVARRKRA